MTDTSTRIVIRADEREELHALARKAGIPLSEAFRRGARLYLTALTLDSPEYRPGRPRKEKGSADHRSANPLPESSIQGSVAA